MIMSRLKGYVNIGVVCFFYWVIDSIWSFYSFEINLKNLIFREPASYIDTFLLRVPPYQIVSRLMVVLLFAILGILIIEFLIKRQTVGRERNEAHDTFLTVLNSIDATVYVSDMQTHEILFMNKYMIDSFGGDFCGQICYEAFRHRGKACDHCSMDKILDDFGNPKGVVVWEGQNPITKAWYANFDRAIRWLDGRIVHLQIATDITQLKELQEKQRQVDFQLRQAQKMESIGKLAGGIAHDFNNILSSIIGFTELVLKDTPQGSSQQAHLKEVYTAGMRAKDLVQQILAFARKSSEETEPVRLSEIINEALRLLGPSTPSTIDIKLNIKSMSFVNGNVTQLHQIVMNLCTNAVYSLQKSGGVLEIELEDRVLENNRDKGRSRLPAGEYVELTVSDNGPGIDSAIMDNIFEPYFTTKGVGEGTGMGLAMVKGIIESYGGSIQVESNPGLKTTFTLRLPVEKDGKLEEVDQACPVGNGTEHILFVDDEPPIARMASILIESLGYIVTTRTSSLDALELFKKTPDVFALVITDMTMPSLTGDALAVELRKIKSDIPVILFTGYSNKINEELARHIGINAFAFKPITRIDFAKTIRQVLDSDHSPGV